MSLFKPPRPKPFDRMIDGVFGRFGAGMGLRVCFVQSAIAAQELESIALVGEIPGSERWPVRDLFQREVDHERVSNALLPWLQDDSKVKFFNPLTLTLLPMDAMTGRIVDQVPTLKSESIKDDDGQTWTVASYQPYYQFRWLSIDGEDRHCYARVEWSSVHARLVAIDGQHRVSALKRFVRDVGGPTHQLVLGWSIPVVVSGLERLDGPDSTTASILDVVRSMFVYINTQARVPTLSRQILLNDENVSYICTQEVLQYAHENDVRSAEPDHVGSRVPLLFFDWRGETIDSRETRSPAALKSIVEISLWMTHYILGPDVDEESADSFGVSDESDELWESFATHKIGPREARLVRNRFRELVLPGFAYLLEEFAPYKEYFRQVRAIEAEWETRGDISRHALARLRFGSDPATVGETPSVDRKYRQLVECLIDAKLEIPHLLAHDIGMRGVVYAFGILRSWYLQWLGSDVRQPWIQYSRWFVGHLNSVYYGDWFGGGGVPHRRFVTANATDSIHNYRVEDAQKALGALVVVLVAADAYRDSDIVTESLFDEVWDEFATSTLANTLRSGYRSYHRGRLRIDNPDWPTGKLKAEVDTRANRAVHGHLAKLRKALLRGSP